MDKLPIYIPTHKRANVIYKRGTLKGFPDEILKRTTLVIYEEELDDYEQHVPYDLVDYEFCTDYGYLHKYKRIGEIAQERGEKYFVILDDDLTFYKRKGRDVTNLINMEPEDYGTMFHAVSTKLKGGYAQVGISAREGNNHIPAWYSDNTRIMRAAAFNTKEFMALEHRLPFMCDFDAALQLLRKGKKNCSIYLYAQNQFQTQAKGGCSEQRNNDNHAEAARALQSHHPEFVKLVQKENKTGGEFGQRLEVRVAWKKAYESATKRKAGFF